MTDDRFITLRDEYRPGLSELIRLKPMLYSPAGDSPLQQPETGERFVGITSQQLLIKFPEAVTSQVLGGEEFLTSDLAQLIPAIINALAYIDAKLKDAEQREQRLLAWETRNTKEEAQRENNRVKARERARKRAADKAADKAKANGNVTQGVLPLSV